MANITALTNTWSTLTEVDLRPLRDQAQLGVRIALVGSDGALCASLADQLRRDPVHPDQETQSPLQILGLDQVEPAENADLIILVIPAEKTDVEAEKALALNWVDHGHKVLVLVDYSSYPDGGQTIIPTTEKKARQVIHGSIFDVQFLHQQFAQVVIQLLPDKLVPLGRDFPLFRAPIARHMINDTSFSNAAFSLSTGLAEIVPIFNIPLVVADSIVLTKNQLFLVYKLGLTLGFSTEWRDYVGEFGGILGAGFFWRQLARSLVGLIPVWGIVPKVAIAYSGTYVVGNVVLQWYLTGRHVSRQQMGELYQRAYTRGLDAARNLTGKLKRRGKRPAKTLPGESRRSLPAPRAKKQVCPNCGRQSAADAAFCQYCGHSFQPLADPGLSI